MFTTLRTETFYDTILRQYAAMDTTETLTIVKVYTNIIVRYIVEVTYICTVEVHM